jgi:membrane-associated phospholipid phosphatase
LAEDSRTPAPVDRLLGGYLLLAATVLLLPHRPAGWPLLLLLHVGLGVALLGGVPGWARARLDRREYGPGRGRGVLVQRTLLDWYPLLLFPFLYWELPFLSEAVWGGRFFDATVMGWEEALFGLQPSTTLARRLDSLLISELLHGAYLAYFPLLYGPPLVLYLRRRRGPFRATVFALMLGFISHYAVFIVFPVQGPRYLFPAPTGQLEAGPLYQLTHHVLEQGSSQGAAFPSAHAALGAVQTVSAVRYLPGAAPLLGAITIGLSIGAVYGGFHYAADILVGLAAGLALGIAAPWVRRRLA